ncbi:2'-5' RNA ligase family protein [Saccharopolyspora rhizosphaerae]|uniref:2'-5' RNA ligase family protein n=1 Tax=Saccharopolyspora rhizosphaerae TaxID=2492662 RepID=A0A3R8P698_9PSEU|nr:2'-5' RNA ligase family protein [Saccharopolyspora rhizosphaerae]RRO17271.1 2'-5' RNA ligase family protein [Saccharopolyspora rhizosphaerae]
MADALVCHFDEKTESQIQDLRERLVTAGIPTAGTRPGVTLALAGGIPDRTRAALRSDLELLSVPDLWLHTLGTVPGDERMLLLSAVVDTELLAVHSAVHDVLAGKVKNPSAYYFPGAWIPCCVLAKNLDDDQLATGFATLLPPEPVRAAVRELAVLDTRTGESDTLVRTG